LSPARTTPAIRKYVAKAIQRYAEVKTTLAFSSLAALQAPVGGVGIPSITALIPSVTQGTSQAQRVGNRIDISELCCNVSLMYQPYNAASNFKIQPVRVKAWIVEQIPFGKPQTAAALGASTEMQNFFQLGGSSAAFQGQIIDQLWEVNTDLFKVHAFRSVTLGNTSIGPSAALGPAATSTQYANVPNYAEWKFKVKNLKKIMYDDTGSNFPQNRNLYLIMTSNFTDGTVNTATQNCVDFQHSTTIKFTDL